MGPKENRETGTLEPSGTLAGLTKNWKHWFKDPKKIQKSVAQYLTETLTLVVGAYWVIFWTFLLLDWNMCNM